MNRRSFALFFSIGVSALMLVACLVMDTTSALSLLALPFTLIGSGLRILSLSGTAGNLISIVLYILISLLPFALLLRKKCGKEDLLLPVSSALLFYVLYYIVNPALRPFVLNNDVGDLILSGVIYSVLGCWAVIKLVRHCSDLPTAGAFRVLRKFLYVCAVIFLLSTAVSFNACRANVASVYAANTMPGTDLTTTVVFMLLSFAVIALEYALMIYVLLLSAKLLLTLEADPYSIDCAEAAARVTLWSRRSLILMVLSNTALQITQILFASRIHHLAVTFRIPLAGLAVSFSMLALSRLLAQGKRIKDDNDLFV